MNVHALDAPSSLALRCFACGVDHPPVQSRSPTCALRRSATLAQLPPEQAASSHTFMRRSHPPVNFLQSIAGKGTRSKLSAGGGAFWLCPPAPGACLLLAAPLRLDRTTCSSRCACPRLDDHDHGRCRSPPSSRPIVHPCPGRCGNPIRRGLPRQNWDRSQSLDLFLYD